jgi:choline dehydrogenase-like flavoprotein
MGDGNEREHAHAHGHGFGDAHDPAHGGAYPDELLPDGAVVEGDALRSDVDEAFDFVVVGSGAAGAVAAHTLAKAGYSVGILEEGPWVRTREFGVEVYPAFARMFREVGTQVVGGRALIPLIQGRCVGGSTVMNSAIAWRTPEDVLDDWGARFGLSDVVTPKALEPHFDALEEALNVHAVDDDVLGENNRLFLEQANASGIAATAMRRYDRGCKGSGRCLTGCPHAAKQGMSVTYVPWALGLGARIFTSCRAERVVVKNGRAVGVLARSAEGQDGGGDRRVLLRARRGVVVAASTVQTPNILHRSGIRSRALGEHFQAHPGVGLAGVFDRRVDMQFGASQGAESIQFRKTERFKLETIGMQPELAAVRCPGIGTELVERLSQLAHAAVWAVQFRASSEGRVRPGWGGRDRVRYSLSAEDVAIARKGLVTLARLLFDAGAKEVWPGVFGLPATLRSMDEVRLLEEGPLDSRAYSFVATHLFGAARMGKDPRASVVGLDFATHDAKGLYVVDSSIFPTNLGVNPQHSIMAMSRLAATRVAASPLAVAA